MNCENNPPGVNRRAISIRKLPGIGKIVLFLECGHKVVFDQSVCDRDKVNPRHITSTACPHCNESKEP